MISTPKKSTPEYGTDRDAFIRHVDSAISRSSLCHGWCLLGSTRLSHFTSSTGFLALFSVLLSKKAFA